MYISKKYYIMNELHPLLTINYIMEVTMICDKDNSDESCDFDEKLLKRSTKGMLKRKMIAMIVLWVINKERTYGYELIKKLNEGTKSYNSNDSKKGHIGPNRIYPILKLLERRKLIEGTWEMEGKRKIKYYETTDRGKLTLKKIKDHMAVETPLIVKEFLNENLFENE